MKRFLPLVVAGLFLLSSSAFAVQLSTSKAYTIQGRHSNKCLVATAGQPQGASCTPAAGQKWKLIKVAGVSNTYMLKELASGKCLVSNAQINDGALYFDTCNSAWWAAHWILTAQDAVNFEIRNRHSNLCLDSPNTTAETSLSKNTCHQGWWSQHWEFLPTPAKDLSWSPLIANDCFIFDAPSPDWYRVPANPSPRCNFTAQGNKPLAWTIASYSESNDGLYTPTGPIPESNTGPGKMMDFEFTPKPNGRHQLSFGLDKITYDNFRDDYTWVGLQDSFDQNWSLPQPTLAQNLYVDFKMGIPEALRATYAGQQGKSRVHIGVSARRDEGGNARSYLMEVVLWHHNEYDGCTPTENWWGQHPASPCDSTGLYDRRSIWGNGEAVYYYAPGLIQLLGYYIPALEPGGESLNYRIPISTLFRGYQWSHIPADWSEVKLGGIYIGIETQGKAITWFELDDYRLYEVGV